MKARVPISHIQGRTGEHLRAMKMFFIFAAYILHNEFGFGQQRLQQFMNAMAAFFEAEKKNDTIGDEALAWAKKHGFMEKE